MNIEDGIERKKAGRPCLSPTMVITKEVARATTNIKQKLKKSFAREVVSGS